MADPKVTQEKEEIVEEQGSLIGTYFSLGLVAAVIVATFILFFAIYYARL